MATADLRRNIGVVLQEPFLFRGTICENLVYGRPDAGAEEAELSPAERDRLIAELEERMKESARKFEFEKAAQYRDRLKALRLRIPNETFNPAGAGDLGSDAA